MESDVLQDLRTWLAHIRWTDELALSNEHPWGMGLPLLACVEGARRLLVDGKRQQAVLDDALSQSKIEINGQAIHFVHIRPKHSSAAPLQVMRDGQPRWLALRTLPDATGARVATIVVECLHVANAAHDFERHQSRLP